MFARLHLVRSCMFRDLTKIVVEVYFYHIRLNIKFQKDLIIRFGGIGIFGNWITNCPNIMEKITGMGGGPKRPPRYMAVLGPNKAYLY